MRTIVITQTLGQPSGPDMPGFTAHERSELHERTLHRRTWHQHFAKRGLEPSYFYGISGHRIGVCTAVSYAEPDRSFSNIGPTPTGIWLSHRTVWAACLLLDDDEFLILEDDAKFPEDWRERFDRAFADVPADWDVIFAGSCCTLGLSRRHVGGELYELSGGPMCLHGYCVRRKALLPLCEMVDEARVGQPIDTVLALHVLPRLRVYTILPRIIDQLDPPAGLAELPE